MDEFRGLDISQTLRPGTTKSIRYALELLSSHLGNKLKIGELRTDTGRDILKLISKLSPNVRKYAEAKEASLQSWWSFHKPMRPYP